MGGTMSYLFRYALSMSIGMAEKSTWGPMPQVSRCYGGCSVSGIFRALVVYSGSLFLLAPGPSSARLRFNVLVLTSIGIASSGDLLRCRRSAGMAGGNDFAIHLS